MIMLSARHLKKSFKRKTVVHDVSFQLAPGQCIGLLGPNGAGKTTSFYMVVGIQTCDDGVILLDGQDISHLPMHERARAGLGYLPQEASIFRKLSVYDNLMAVLELRPELTPLDRAERAEILMEEFHVSHLRDSLGLRLSGGERRRVEIARALAMEPKFILLDEPFAGVDPISVIDIKQIIQQVCQKNIGILITDHNVRETLSICEYAYIINLGRVLCEGSPQDILKNEEVRAVYLGKDFVL
ncbi:MAG: LPS export ABC transporter ATP-binding protein [Legionellaceae bacterium]|nr:LPS export ABC transporter ATP-binding protein [Legionellaceae bacterium]